MASKDGAGCKIHLDVTEPEDSIELELQLPRSRRIEVEELAAKEGVDVPTLVKRAVGVLLNLDTAFDFVRYANGDREKFVRGLRACLFEEFGDDSVGDDLEKCWGAMAVMSRRKRAS